MRNATIVLMLSFAFCFPALAGNAQCRAPKNTTDLIPPLAYEVAGTGRLYFHSAPNPKCVVKGVFVIPGNQLIAREEFKDWTLVEFFTEKSESVVGWVITRRLKFTGTSGHTDESDYKFYEKAKADADAGKLGSPFAR